MMIINKTFKNVLIITSILFSSCNNQEEKQIVEEKSGTAKFKFEKDFYDFGKINNGDTVLHVFSFVNIGKEPLIIKEISTGCGCTVADWSKYPVLPGKDGSITVKFSKVHDPGRHQKNIIIKANTEDPYSILKIRAQIIN